MIELSKETVGQVRARRGAVNFAFATEADMRLLKSATNGDLQGVKQALVDEASIDVRDAGGRTALHLAVKHGDSNVVSYLLDIGMSVDVMQFWDSGTPLMEARNESMAKLLIARGASLTQKGILGDMLIHLAAKNGWSDVIIIMLDKGISVDAPGYQGRTPLMEARDESIAKLLIARGASFDIKANGGDMPIHQAATRGLADVITMILDKGMPVDARDIAGRTPLMGARSENIAKLLIERGASFNVKDNNGDAPIHHAAEYGWVDVIAFMLDDGVPIDIVGEHGQTPLMKARTSAVMELLMKRGASVCTRADNGDTPLHFASNRHMEEVVVMMLDRGAPVDAIGDEGRTPLMNIGFGQDEEDEKRALSVARFLMERGASLYAKATNSDMPIHFAASGGLSSVVAIMLDAGVPIDVLGSEGRTPLMVSGPYWYEEEALPVAELLIRRGASLYAKASNGDMPIHFSARHGFANITAIMLDKGMPVDIVNVEGRTPLMMTCLEWDEEGALATAKLLLERGALISAKANDGDMPIHFAASKGFAEIVAYMLDKGVSVNARGAKHRTPFMLAKNEATAKLLIERRAWIGEVDQEGNSFLHVAALMDHWDILSFLLRDYLRTRINSNYDWWRLIKSRNKQGRTALMESASPHMAKLLLREGIDDARDKDGNKAIHIAVINGNIEVVRFWLDKERWLINELGAESQSLLTLAMNHEHTEIVKLLYQRRANTAVRDKDGGTILHFASRFCDVGLLESLLKDDGCDVNVMHHCDNAVEFCGDESSKAYTNVSITRRCCKVAESRVQLYDLCWMKADSYSHGLDMKILDSEYAELVKDCNVYINTQIHDLTCSQYSGTTPLHLAAKFGQDACVERLLAKNANISAIASDGARPIHYAVLSNHSSTVELLVGAGANMTAAFPNGTAVLDIATGCKDRAGMLIRIVKRMTDDFTYTQNGCVDSQSPGANNYHHGYNDPLHNSYVVDPTLQNSTFCSGAVESTEE